MLFQQANFFYYIHRHQEDGCSIFMFIRTFEKMGMLVAEPSLLWLLAFSLIGVLLGTATGIIPGIHPNNVALILLSLLPALSHSLSAFLPAAPVLLASLLIAASITHTFLSFIPAAFVGAPEGDTALCVLPAHHLLLEGRAYEAVKLSAAGSFLALICSFLFLMPFKFFLCLLYTSPSPRDRQKSRMPSSA